MIRWKGPIDADLIIAGAGPAGLSLAAALADAPIRIVVVERGKVGDLATSPSRERAENYTLLTECMVTGIAARKGVGVGRAAFSHPAPGGRRHVFLGPFAKAGASPRGWRISAAR